MTHSAFKMLSVYFQDLNEILDRSQDDAFIEKIRCVGRLLDMGYVYLNVHNENLNLRTLEIDELSNSIARGHMEHFAENASDAVDRIIIDGTVGLDRAPTDAPDAFRIKRLEIGKGKNNKLVCRLRLPYTEERESSDIQDAVIEMLDHLFVRGNTRILILNDNEKFTFDTKHIEKIA